MDVLNTDTRWLTVIIPAYNAGETLQKTVNSVLFQTQKDFSIIIIDDGSTDEKTAEIGKNYAKHYPKQVTYLYEENHGLGYARNRGMALASTPYIAFLDSDDWLMPNFVEALQPHADVDMIFTLPQIYDETTGLISDWYDKPLFDELFPKDGDERTLQQDIRLMNLEVSSCRRIYRTSFLQEVAFRFPEEVKWEDVFAHFYLLSKCRSCKGVGSTGFYYRVGSNSQITAQGGSDRLDIIPVFWQILDNIGNQDRPDMIYPVMRSLLRFSVSFIRRADMDIRPILVEALHALYHEIPRQYFHILNMEARRYHTRTDRMQYRFFAAAIRHYSLNWICKNYLIQDIGELLIRKLLHAKGKVQ